MKNFFRYTFFNLRIISFLFLLLLTSCHNLFVFHDDPKVKKGVLDISNFNLENHAPLHIVGEVEFYWNQLLTPKNFATDTAISNKQYINLPNVWNSKVVDGVSIQSDGYATYRFVIKTNKDGLYGLKLNEVDCAYKIWANNACDSVGKVATSKKEIKPSWRRKELYFNSFDKKIEIVIQVANFNHRKGGLEDVILFGTASQIIKAKQKSIGLNIFLLSIIMIVGLSHLFMVWLRKQERNALLFGLICVLMSIRLLCTSEKLIYELLPNISWDVAVRIEYFSYTIIVPLMMAFLHSYYPKEISKTILKLSFLLAAIFSISYFTTSVKLFSYTPIAYQIIIFATGVYMLYALTKASIKKEENAFIFLGGFVIFFIIVLNDILYYNKIINTSLLMPYGLAFMVVSQSFAITRRQIRAFNDNEKLTAELDRYNHELESIVYERTQKIQHQNEELEAQADKLKEINERLIELSQFKDNMTGMVVHDMKNHLNNIILLSENQENISNGLFDVNDAMRHSAKQLFTLVMNILDIQRFEDAHMELDLQNISINLIVDNARKDLDAMSRSKEISIINSTSKDTYVNADPVIVHRILINLISNAIKFSSSNSTINICSENANGFVKLTVIDHGVGIPNSIKEKVFNKYETFNHHSDTKVQSTGLGLTFCKLAVEAHNGRIGVDDADEQGSIFWFTLPVGIAPQVNQLDENEEQTVVKSTVLSDSDIQNIGQYAVKLSKVKYYEVSRVNLILNDIKNSLDENYSESINDWTISIKKAVIHSSKEVFESKIKEVLDRYSF